MKPWRLDELNLHEVRARGPWEVAVIPFGATEPHNLHLPYGTDTCQVDRIGDMACERAFGRGARVCLLPAIPYGTESNLMRFPLAMNLQPSTLARVIGDLVDSLETHGIPKIVLLNGHGGNDLKWLLRELHGRVKPKLFLCNWYKVATDHDRTLFDGDPGDHAGRAETSLMMAFRPDLVRAEQADPGAVAKSRFEAVNRGWVEITRPFDLLTTNSGVGAPFPADAETGRKLAGIVAERIADFLVELSASPVDETFPY